MAPPDTWARAKTAGLDAHVLLSTHDSYSFSDGIGDLVRTGLTLAYVHDIRAVLID
ncbi:MOFRL family protein [Rhodoblastus acidophilus]|uniref:MOFRL family protein n=1 Tax=Rhodoblastus acidophilus TaxID=1074 RepID=UPI000B500FCA|nr:MOFRL family protein [Rhodoblastus acidophilus]PPQ34693.1 hypothetical protein CKO16_22150 [Rhodoblastus acidophilus]RAI16388.1 hypothetical protein CH337_21650 [Rhodoblastus acidophilus]